MYIEMTYSFVLYMSMMMMMVMVMVMVMCCTCWSAKSHGAVESSSNHSHIVGVITT